jgi:hypothetical protein
MKASRVFLATALVVIATWIATPFVLPLLATAEIDVGKIGDMYGAANALFSGLALVGAVYAILLQREELLEQRMEFERQTEQFKLQNELLSKQLQAAESNARAAAIKEKLASLPFFRFRSGGFNSGVEHFKFTNVGADVFHPQVYVEGGREYSVTQSADDCVRRDDELHVSITPHPEGKLRPYTLVITYTTVLGERLSTRYASQANGSRPNHVERA